MTEDPIKAVCHYAQALKAPRIRESAARLAEQARDGVRSLPARPPARRSESALPGSQPENRWRTSISITSQHLTGT